MKHSFPGAFAADLAMSLKSAQRVHRHAGHHQTFQNSRISKSGYFRHGLPNMLFSRP